MSANLWNGSAAPDIFAALVATLDADVVATQEMTPEQAEALARVLPHGRLDPARDYSGMGIALREPAPIRRLALPGRDARIADLSWEGPAGTRIELEILSVHVQAPHGSWNAPGWRRGQLRGLVQHLAAAPTRRRVLVGDLNATPMWPVYRRLSAHLTDAAVVAAQRHGRSVESTWGPWPWAPQMLRIDHALVDGVAVEDFRVLPIPGSDHSAIVVDVVVPLSAGEPPRAPAEATRPTGERAPGVPIER